MAWCAYFYNIRDEVTLYVARIETGSIWIYKKSTAVRVYIS